MDGENNGKPLFKIDDLGGKPYFRKCPHIFQKGSMGLVLILRIASWIDVFDVRPDTGTYFFVDDFSFYFPR